jgi:putative FmdB family regulatory protein
MPIYGYECDQCGHQLEVLQSFSDPPIRSCPECMGPMQKMLYPVGVIFKGSGFYTTDYRNGGGDGSGKSSSSETKPASETKSDSGSNSESKPDSGSKPESKAPDSGTTKPDAKAAS